MKLRNSSRIIYSISLIIILIAYKFNPSFKSNLTEVVLLFTANSKEQISGYLNAFNTAKPIASIGLAVFQSLAVPFRYEPLLLANISLFGFRGCLYFILGKLIGAMICYDIAKSFIPGNFFNRIKLNNLFSVLLRTLPINFNFMSYFMGAVKIDALEYLLNSLAWISITTALYYWNDGYFQYSQEMYGFYIRLVLSGVLSIVLIKKNKFKKTYKL